MVKIAAASTTTAGAWPETDRAQVLDALRFLLDGSLTERPRRRPQGAENVNDLGWVFVAGRDFRPVHVRTYASLEKKLAAGAVYFTPNSFFARHRKTKDALRWLNVLFVDIDDPGMTVPDVLDRCAEEGLPLPTLANKTPNGLHVYWKLVNEMPWSSKRVRATRKALNLYSALLRRVAAALDGDQAASTAERFLRIPNRLVYYNKVEYTLQDFCDWRDINSEVAAPEPREAGSLVTAGILDHPAVKRLLDGVEKGRRDNTAFTLALAFKVAGYSQEQALDELISWNFRNRPPLPFAQLRGKVRSAYQDKYRAPSAYWITQLSGVPFKYQVITKRGEDMAKKRPHGRPDLKPAAREKLLALLRENGGRIETRNQKELGKLVGVSTTTVRRVVAGLKDEGLMTVETKRLGKGRGAVTTYSLIGDTCAYKAEVEADAGKTIARPQNTIHFGGGVVGGCPRPSVATRNENVIPFPGARSGRDQGEGAG